MRSPSHWKATLSQLESSSSECRNAVALSLEGDPLMPINICVNDFHAKSYGQIHLETIMPPESERNNTTLP